jgi:hypothetical protein
MASNFENLSLDLALRLVRLQQEGVYKAPYTVSLTAADGRFLGSFEFDKATEVKLTSADTTILENVLPVTVTVTDINGKHLEWRWTQPQVN